MELDIIPCLKVLNKIDLVEQEFVEEQCRKYQAVALSALDAKTFSTFFDAAQKIIGRLENLEDFENHLSVN